MPILRKTSLPALLLLAGLATGAAAMEMKAPGLDIVGFNGRGLLFGIEQFGQRPGSGIPYSEIRIYDLRTDREIDRSPFVYDEHEKIPAGVTMKAAIDRARRAVYLDARRVIRYLTLVPRGLTITPKGGHPARALQISAPGLSGLLSLETFPLPSSDPACTGVKAMGLILKLTNEKGETEIHHDKTLPRGRGCPVDYDIRQAHVYLPHPQAASLAVVVGVHQGGKEAGTIRYTVSGHVYKLGEKP